MLKGISKSDKGSTLLTVIMTFSILSVLGLAVLSLSVTGYQAKASDKKVKEMFYLAESGLDQAYGIVMEVVNEAIKEAKSGNEQEIINLVAREERNAVDNTNYSSPFIRYDANGKAIFDENTKESQAYIEDLKLMFQTIYSNYINTHLEAKLNDKNNYVNLSDGTKTITATESQSIAYLPTQNKFDPDKYKIHMNSKYESKDSRVMQTVQCDFVVEIPNDIRVSLKAAVGEIKTNNLWQEALISFKDIPISGGEVKVDGGVFALGSVPVNKNDKKDVSKYGGVTVGANDKPAKVIINGDVCSPKANVQVSAKNSSLSIGGDVYAYNLVVNKMAMGLTDRGGNISVAGHVFTKDDLELNGKKSSITIEGSYYGISDGSTGDVNGEFLHDSSSSIVINSTDIADKGGSMLTIKGPSTFMGGVVYIPVDDPEVYFTGESVSVVGNYSAYSQLSDICTIQKEYKLGNKSIMLTECTSVKEQSDHIMEIYNADPGLFNVGYYNLNDLDSTSINIKNIGMSLGAYIRKGALMAPNYELIFFEELLKGYGEIYKDVCAQVYNPDASDPSGSCKYYDFGNMDTASYPRPLNGPELLRITDKNIALIGPNGNSLGLPNGIEQVNLTSQGGKSYNAGGIIISKGDIYLRGKINFRGLILAKGNIIISDDNEKTFTANPELARKLIALSGCNENQFPDRSTKVFAYVDSGSIADFTPHEQLIRIEAWKKSSN